MDIVDDMTGYRGLAAAIVNALSNYSSRRASCDTCLHWMPFSVGIRGECESEFLVARVTHRDETRPNSLCYGHLAGPRERRVETGPKFGCVHWQAKETA